MFLALRRSILLAACCLGVAGALRAADVSAPVPVNRSVLCLFGFQADDPTRAPVWPPDTYTAQMLQTAMEWAGYLTEFHDVGTGRPADDLDPRFCAIVIDSVLELPFAEEFFYLNWLLRQKERGLKLVFVGGYPGDDKARRHELAHQLGIRGSLEDIKGVKSAKFRVKDKSMVDDALLPRPRTSSLISAQAPEHARVWLSVSAVDSRDIELTTDVLYTADWGGALLEPYLYFRTSPDDVRSVADMFAWVETILPAGRFPVPDTTTRAGLRMFLTHIDGDGFTTLSRQHLNTTCAEIVRDEFLKKYPFPVTVSIIESEIKGLLKEQDSADRERFETIARSIFELENVQVASHAWSHPFCWMPGRDIEGGRGYATPWLEFADEKEYPAFDLKREIEGSVHYINESLTPRGKPVELFLWSGNCRPSGEALRMVASLGLESLNGGNTVINRRAEGIGGISPADTFMDGELQIYSPVQNEFTYTNGFTGPLYGGYRLVIDTFERTGSPRRLKPVNAYYHFYSVQSGESQRALRDVYDWCLSQPLHSITARDFVRLAKDARATRISMAGPKRYVIENAGICRTYRVPESWGAPNLALCEGVTGWRTEAGQTYVHTYGYPRAVLDFSAPAAGATGRPFLVSSTGEADFSRIAPHVIEGFVRDLRANTVTLAGLSPDKRYEVTVRAQGKVDIAAAQVDRAGTLRLELPPVCAFLVSRLAD